MLEYRSVKCQPSEVAFMIDSHLSPVGLKRFGAMVGNSPFHPDPSIQLHNRQYIRMTSSHFEGSRMQRCLRRNSGDFAFHHFAQTPLIKSLFRSPEPTICPARWRAPSFRCPTQLRCKTHAFMPFGNCD